MRRNPTGGHGDLHGAGRRHRQLLHRSKRARQYDAGVRAVGGLNKIGDGRNFFQHGIYFNYHFDTPLPVSGRYSIFSKIDLVSDVRSDYFLGECGYTPVDTRFLVDARESPNVPIFSLFSGNVSLTPTLEVIWYGNKVNRNLYGSVSTSISLSYSFKKRTGLAFLKTLGSFAIAWAPAPHATAITTFG